MRLLFIFVVVMGLCACLCLYTRLEREREEESGVAKEGRREGGRSCCCCWRVQRSTEIVTGVERITAGVCVHETTALSCVNRSVDTTPNEKKMKKTTSFKIKIKVIEFGSFK